MCITGLTSIKPGGSNTGGALLQFSIRAAMQMTSCISSAISVWTNWQNFTPSSSRAAIAQCVRRWAIDHMTVQGVSSRPLGDYEFTEPSSVIILFQFYVWPSELH